MSYYRLPHGEQNGTRKSRNTFLFDNTSFCWCFIVGILEAKVAFSDFTDVHPPISVFNTKLVCKCAAEFAAELKPKL